MSGGRFAIFGTGGFGREIARPARLALEIAAASGAPPRELLFVEDEPQGPVMGIPAVRPEALCDEDEFVVAVGDPRVRRSIAERLAARAGMLVAPTATIGDEVSIGEGAIFCDYSMVTASARIGRHFHANIYSYVAHDCVIGDYVTFAPKVCCNGNVVIEDDVYVGTGAVLRQGTRGRPLVIGRNAVIGMGAVVTKDVPAGAVVVGNPARPLRPER